MVNILKAYSSCDVHLLWLFVYFYAAISLEIMVEFPWLLPLLFSLL